MHATAAHFYWCTGWRRMPWVHDGALFGCTGRIVPMSRRCTVWLRRVHCLGATGALFGCHGRIARIPRMHCFRCSGCAVWMTLVCCLDAMGACCDVCHVWMRVLIDGRARQSHQTCRRHVSSGAVVIADRRLPCAMCSVHCARSEKCLSDVRTLTSYA